MCACSDERRIEIIKYAADRGSSKTAASTEQSEGIIFSKINAYYVLDTFLFQNFISGCTYSYS